MALSDPPEVKIGDLPWTVTEWDLTGVAVETVQRGRPSLPADGQEWLYWRVQYADEYPRVCKLLCAGPQAPSSSALFIAEGTYSTKVRRTTTDQLIVRDGGTLIVGSGSGAPSGPDLPLLAEDGTPLTDEAGDPLVYV